MKNNTLVGMVKRHPDGFGFLIPDDPEHPDVYIPRKSMKGVMTLDRVEVLAKKEKGSERYSGEILSIVERGVKKIVGLLAQKNKGDFTITGGFEKWGALLKIDKSNSAGAVVGDMVAVEILQYPADNSDFKGKVIEVIGDKDDANNDLKRVLHEKDIPMEFDPAVLKAARKISQTVSSKDCVGRTDLRDKPFITIDGVTAKDFDDAIYVENKGPSGFYLWVAIADVSHYVPRGGAIDISAIERGTSVYLPNFVVPMLPEELSNGICSLNPEVDRLALVCQMEISFDGIVSHPKVFEAVICSHARVTYGEAQDILNGDLVHSVSKVQKNILLARDLAKILMAKRFREGSLDLEVPETEVIVNEMGQPVDIIKSERVFAHRLIEEMMLIANVSVANLIIGADQEGLFRIHESPNQEDIQRIQSFLDQFGSQRRLGGGHLQSKLTRSLQDFKGKPEGVVLNILTLRSMSQAKYSSNNIGHFGLGFENYSHFTSPIRRYPDLIIHRILKGLFTNSKSGSLYSEGDLTTFGNTMSACEQRAVKAERRVVSIKKARFMEDKVGETFSGLISSVAKFGVFVLLRAFDVDGLVKVEELGDDFFEFDEENLRLVGKKTRVIYKIGDLLDIRVAGVDTIDGKIDFVLEKKPQKKKKKSLKDYLKSGRSQEKNKKEFKGKSKKNRGKSAKIRTGKSKFFNDEKEDQQDSRPKKGPKKKSKNKKASRSKNKPRSVKKAPKKSKSKSKSKS